MASSSQEADVAGGWNVCETRDRDRILSILDQDRVFAAYAIGDLEPSLFEHCRWAVAEDGRGRRSLALLFKGLEPDTLLLYGDTQGCDAILRTVMRPASVYTILAESHLPALQAHYTHGPLRPMWRMVWSGNAASLPTSERAFRLAPVHLARLKEMYALYEAAHFSAYQLEDGVFYGVEHNGHLVAVAGTHLISRAYGVAAIGNVFTHPDYRGRGYARECVSCVVRDLAGEVTCLVLNVGAQNLAARHLYASLGFSDYCTFVEVMAYRKDDG